VKFKGGFAEKDGVKFAVAQMDSSIVDVPGKAMDMIPRLKTLFPDMNIVLMTRNKKGSPIFYGRPDIVNGLGDTALSDVEWKEYELE